MVNHYNNIEYKGPSVGKEPNRLDKLLSDLNSGLEELRNGMPLNQRFEILMKDEGASFKVGNTKGDIFVRISGASFEMQTKKGRGSETKSFEYFSLQDLLQAVAKIFSYEMSNQIKSE